MAEDKEIFGVEFMVRDYECDLQGVGLRQKTKVNRQKGEGLPLPLSTFTKASVVTVGLAMTVK